MKVIDYLRFTYNKEEDYNVRLPIICMDGYTVSIQGGTTAHYCYPRKHTNQYELVELGYPSSHDLDFDEYAEQIECVPDTVYGYVPIEIVENVIQKHGGLDIDKMSDMWYNKFK